MRFILIFLITISQVYAETKPVPRVDLEKYMGTWYEIASIPQKFTKGCVCTRAKYTLKKNGKVEVYNSCNKDSVNGELSDIKGTAKVADKKSNAKLKVSFFWPFYADYWIVGLADDYRYAVVSNEEGDTLWILSRVPELDEADLKDIHAIIVKNGIDLKKLKTTEQTGCSYPAG